MPYMDPMGYYMILKHIYAAIMVAICIMYIIYLNIHRVYMYNWTVITCKRRCFSLLSSFRPSSSRVYMDDVLQTVVRQILIMYLPEI